MKQKTGLSIIITWKNREELAISLNKNTNIFNKYSNEILIINCGGNFDNLLKIVQDTKINNCKVINLNCDFNKALAMNVGAYKSNYQNLFFLDADIILNEAFFEESLNILQKKVFITVGKVFESQPVVKSTSSFLKEIAYFIEFLDIENNRVSIQTSRFRFNECNRSGPGLIMLKRKHFINVNGMNSNLKFWGWEDLDLIARLQFKIKLKHLFIGSVMHISHGDNVRNLNNKAKVDCESQNLATCIANYKIGNYNGTFIEDVRCLEEKLI